MSDDLMKDLEESLQRGGDKAEKMEEVTSGDRGFVEEQVTSSDRGLIEESGVESNDDESGDADVDEGR